MGDIAIQVCGLGKQYQIGAARDKSDGLRHAIESGLRRFGGRLRGRSGGVGASSEDFWALKDVSFEVKRGECVGVIGRNGAGKSTLLKILSRITEPTEGEVQLRGRVGSLLEVGTGFHPELTGRENIYLNGSVLGMSRREVKAKFDEIVAFSEVEKFLDTPVKRYSSGMYVRLAFAVAAHLEPEILIVDEVLAVGDSDFQKKCIAKMRTVGYDGKTVLLVSHNLVQIEALCSTVVTLHQGRTVGYGLANDQVRSYLARLRQSSGAQVDLRDHPNRVRGTSSILVGLSLQSDGMAGAVARMSGSFGFTVSYKCHVKPQNLKVGFVLENEFGVKVTAMSATFEEPDLLFDPPISGHVTAEVQNHNLVAGVYAVNVYIDAGGTWDTVETAAELVIEADDVFSSGRTLDMRTAVTYQRCKWTKSW